MRPEKQWEIDAVAMLIIGLSISILAGAGATLILKQSVADLRVTDEKFYSFVISSVFFQGVALALTHVFLRQHGVAWREFLGLFDPGWRRALVLGLITAVAVLPLALGLNALSKLAIERFQPEATLQPTLQVLHIAVTVPRRICMGFTAIIMAPLVEEILFRGIAYKALRERGHPRLALVASSVLFGLIHVNLMTLVPLTVLGIVFALLYERTGNLLAPVAAHSLFNAINFSYFLHAAK